MKTGANLRAITKLIYKAGTTRMLSRGNIFSMSAVVNDQHAEYMLIIRKCKIVGAGDGNVMMK